MGDNKVQNYIEDVLENMPTEWLRLTTHRLDIYNESLAKTEFLELFENFIKDSLPAAKINFVSEKLAQEGFTPSVFSLDLPTKGNTDEEREAYKRTLNQKLIDMMIGQIPNESKYCVSYGQLKGCYWIIPATSTQGTTKEDDKDYIARVSISPDLDLELHKKVFLEFVEQIKFGKDVSTSRQISKTVLTGNNLVNLNMLLLSFFYYFLLVLL